MNKEFDESVKNLIDTIKTAQDKGTDGYDTQAEVKRIDGQTAWVHIPGGVDETPIQMTINANIGDLVQVRVAGGTAWITGNLSAPPTDNKFAEQVKEDAETAILRSKAAHDSSELAIAILQGKTTNFFQSEEPSKISRIKGDVWFNTGDNNYISYWNGKAWTKVTSLKTETVYASNIYVSNATRTVELSTSRLVLNINDNRRMLLNEGELYFYNSTGSIVAGYTSSAMYINSNRGSIGIQKDGIWSDEHIYLNTNTRAIMGALTSGTFKQLLTMSSSNNIVIGDGNYTGYGNVIIYAGTGGVAMYTSLGYVYFTPGTSGEYNLFRPGDDNKTYLGASNGRWKNIYTYDVNLGGISLAAPYNTFEVTALNTSYVSISNQLNKYYPTLKLVHLQFLATITGRAWTAGELFSIANIPTAYKPAYTTSVTVATTGTTFWSGIQYPSGNTDYPGYIRIKCDRALTSQTVNAYVNVWYHLNV